MKFLVCKKQEGEGCDYTIGCGMDYDIVDAESIEQAIIDAVYPDGRDEASSLEGENAIVEIIIAPAEFILRVDIERIKAGIDLEKAMASEMDMEKKERAELERLQAKYKGGSDGVH